MNLQREDIHPVQDTCPYLICSIWMQNISEVAGAY